MATDIQVQSGIIGYGGATRGSDGTLYTVYIISTLRVGYSTDGGLTWTEVNSGITGGQAPRCAIDSADVLHIAYTHSQPLKYVQFTINGGFTTPETTGLTASTAEDCAIAVDSNDNVHVVQDELGGNESIYYAKRTAGTWGGVTSIMAGTGFGNEYGLPRIVIDSTNRIFVTALHYTSGTEGVRYVRYNGSSWSSPTLIGSTNVDGNTTPYLVVDSSDNVYVIWQRTTNVIAYAKYTRGTDTWAAEAAITTAATANAPSITIDASDVITAVFNSHGSPSDIYFIQYNGSWGAETKILDASGSDSFVNTFSNSTVWPLVAGLHTNIPISGYSFIYYSTLPQGIRYYASTGINFQAAQTQTYSREASASLPTNDSNLTSMFTSSEYTEVATQDSTYAPQTASDQYAIQEFKNRNTSNTAPISVTWTGKTNIAPATSTVYLQIFNRNSGLWETLGSDSTSSVNTNFTIAGTVTTNLDHYYNGSNWVSCRVYQLAQ